MKDRNYTTEQMLKLEPDVLLKYLTENYTVDMPISIDTKEQVKKASEEMAKASAYYAFLTPLKLQANILKRVLKNKKEDKILIEDMLVRETIIDAHMSVMRQSYDTISRLFTIRYKEQEEIRMMQ